MHQRNFWFRMVLLFLLILAAPLTVSAQTKSLPSRENDEGQVMVTVTPVALSATADTWRFDVQLNTHVAPITQDLAAVSLLSDGKGHEERPSGWQGDPPGGHHRKGTLLFKPLSPMPESVTLTIGDVGSIARRSFTWTLKD